jgi:ABC-type nitrate/sulfonate/bicarbonate transport system ATPase subunit
MADIEIHGLTKRFASRTDPAGLVVLDDISFGIEDHQVVCVLGASGCGKSTLLNVVSGLDREHEGRVTFGGAPLLASGPPVRIGYVFQDSRLLPWRSVRDNILFALKQSDVPASERRDRCQEWIDNVGLHGFEDAYPHELSGGMQQRTSIARAFAIDPDVLLMDEPFSGLDEFTARSMRQQLLRIWVETRKTVMFVTHHCFEACYLADRILILGRRPGRVVEDRVIDVPRPRDYDSSELFEMSVEVIRSVTSSAEDPAVVG